jgi:hypothetical protein
MLQDRRTFLKLSGMGLLGFSVGGATLLLTPAEAKEKNIPLKILTDDEARTLEALGETLHPGASQAGLVHFVDHQLSVEPDDCLSLVKYFVNDPPFVNFYRAGFKSLQEYSKAKYGATFVDLKAVDRIELVKTIGRDNPKEWPFPPPAPLFYMVVRNDTADVLYGTMEGFRRLGVPYMPHIVPPERW